MSAGKELLAGATGLSAADRVPVRCWRDAHTGSQQDALSLLIIFH